MQYSGWLFPNLARGLAALAVAAVFGLVGCGKDDPVQLIRSAKDYQAKGDHQAAIIQLKNVLQKHPESGEARLLLGQSALIVGDPSTAEKEFRRALEQGQPRAVIAPLLAQALLDSGAADKVIAEFDSERLDSPRAEAELKARVGEAQIRAGKHKDAAASFDAALVAEPSNVRARLGQIRLAAFQGKFDDALAAADDLVAKNPQSAEALVLQAETKLFLGDRAGARAALQRAVEVEPAQAIPRFELISLMIAEGDLDAAAAQVNAARSAHGGDLRLQYFDALIALGRKDFAKAREISQQLLKRAPKHVPTLVIASGVDLQEKQYALAESQLQRALQIAPQHANARKLLVRTYLASSQPARALETLQPLVARGMRIDASTMMLAGETYLANGDLKQATGYFEAASTSKAQEPLAKIRLGQIAIVSGDVETGVRDLEAAVSTEGAPMQADLALIAAYARQGQSDKAVATARALVEKQPSDPTARQILGALYLSRKEMAAARASFAKALELNPVYLPAAAGLARIDFNENKPADARARFESVVAKDPKNELALLGLAEVMATTKAAPADIAAVVQRAIAAKPDSATARVALVNLYLQGKKPREALTAAQEANAALPRDARVIDALGRAQLAAGETNQAIETFNRLAAAEPGSVAPLMRLASVYVNRQEPEKAIEALQRAQKIAPADPTVGRDLVLSYLTSGKVEEALKQAKALEAAAPASPIGFALEGDIYATTKQWQSAERAYREGLKADPAAVALAVKLHGVLLAAGKKAEADALARKWIAERPKDVAFRTYIAEQSLRNRDLKAASGHYQAIIAQQPDNVAALNNLAWTLGQLGDPNALEYGERALKIAPDSPLVLDTVGVLLVAKGDAKQGVEYLSRAVAKAPDRPDIRLNYAKALLKAGRTEDARRELKLLQDIKQDFPGKAEIAGLLKQ